MLAWEIPDLPAVVRHFERAASLYRQAEDGGDTGRALLNLSMATAEMGDGAKAASLRDEAVALLEAAGDQESLAVAAEQTTDQTSQADRPVVSYASLPSQDVGYATVYAPTDRVVTAEQLRQFGEVLQVDVQKSFLGKPNRIQVALSQCGITLDLAPAKLLKSYHIPQALAHIEQTAADGLTPEMRDRVAATHLVLGVKVEPCHDPRGQSKAFIRALVTHYDGFFSVDDTYYDPSGAVLIGPRNAKPF